LKSTIHRAHILGIDAALWRVKHEAVAGSADYEACFLFRCGPVICSVEGLTCKLKISVVALFQG
jgi:hypothetical protein